MFKILAIAILLVVSSGCAMDTERAEEVQLTNATAECVFDAQGAAVHCVSVADVSQVDTADEGILKSLPNCSDDINGDGEPDICLCGDGGDCEKIGGTWWCGCS